MASRKLEVVIAGDASGAKRAFKETERAAGGFKSKMASVGRSVLTIGTAAAAGLGAVGAAAAGWGLKIAADNETASVSFELLLGNAEDAGKLMGELQQFAAKTPFEFPELRTAASRLLAVGTSADRVIPIMETLGDATAGMGTGAEGIQRAVTALTQMEQKGKVTAEEMMQLTEAGIPAWDALASVMGVTVAEAQEKVSTGTVKAATLFQALEQKAGPALQRLSGLMDKQSATLSGMLSTLKDTVGQNLGKQLQPLASAIKGLLPDITKMADQLAGVFGFNLAKLAGPLVDVVSTLGKTAGPVIASLASGFAQIFDGLSLGLKGAGPGLAKFADAFGHISEVLGPVAFLLGNALGEALDQLGPVLDELIEALKPVATILGATLIEALQALRPIWPVVIDAIRQLSPLITQLAQELSEQLVKALTDLVPVLLENAPAMIKITENLLKITIAILPLLTVVAQLMTLFVRLEGLLFGAVGAALAYIVAGWGKVADATQRAGSILSSAWTRVRQVVTVAMTAVRQVIESTLTSILSRFSGFASRIGSAVAGVASALSAPFRAAGEAIKAAWNSTIGGRGIHIGGFDPPGPGSFPGFDLSIPRLHSGGMFRAPRPGGEGLALLKDREIVLPPGRGRQVTVNNVFHITESKDARSTAAAVEAIFRRERAFAGATALGE